MATGACSTRVLSLSSLSRSASSAFSRSVTSWAMPHRWTGPVLVVLDDLRHEVEDPFLAGIEDHPRFQFQAGAFAAGPVHPFPRRARSSAGTGSRKWSRHSSRF